MASHKWETRLRECLRVIQMKVFLFYYLLVLFAPRPLNKTYLCCLFPLWFKLGIKQLTIPWIGAGQLYEFCFS